MNEGQIGQLVFLALIVALFWFFIIRPARNRQRDSVNLQRGLEVGQKVMLTSGIHGQIASLDDETLELTIAPGTVVTVHRQAVMKTLSEPDASESSESSDTDEAVRRDGDQPA